ncbi:unnamed protein product [Rhodiola kirilowii]
MPKHFRPAGKKKEGNAAKYVTRSRALRMLQVPLPLFRKMCIYKGVFPREPKKKVQGNHQTYYHMKDIMFLQHEKLIDIFRDIKVHDKKVKKAKAKKQMELAIRLMNRKPSYTLDRLIKERYPQFVDALRDLDDCLTMVHLFAALPALDREKVPVERIHKCRRLCHEWQAFISRTHKLRKTFISVKGIYYQVEVVGQQITWLTPHATQQVLTDDVDYNVMLTFLEFYETLLEFVNCQLYTSINVSYPPILDPELEALAADLYAISRHFDASRMSTAPSYQIDDSSTETAQRDIENDESELRLAQLQHQLPYNEHGALMQLMKDDVDEDDEETKECKSLFKDLKFYLSREVPRESLLFIIPAFGGVVSWEGDESPLKESDQSITHQIVDRPSQGHMFLSREYVQPQWVFDCVNARILLPTEPYKVGRVPPPHLSPFVDNEAEGYVPEYAETIRRLQAAAKKEVLPLPGVGEEDIADPQNLLIEGVINRAEANETAKTHRRIEICKDQYYVEVKSENSGAAPTPVISNKTTKQDKEATTKSGVDEDQSTDPSLVGMTRKKRGLYEAMQSVLDLPLNPALGFCDSASWTNCVELGHQKNSSYEFSALPTATHFYLSRRVALNSGTMRFRFASAVAHLLLVVVVITVVDVTGSNLVSGPHIADVNLLLPPKMTHPVEYMLLGSDGCFKWSWDHHDMLSVQPEYNASTHCSTSARVKSIAPYNGRRETAIYATDVHTGLVIRCKVYIDRFSRIQIFHNSIKLDLDGLATLRVRGFDSEDNIFSSLVGLQFKWQLTPEDDDSIHHLEHIPLKNSPLSDCGGLCGDLETQIKLEDSGSFSDLFVVKGTAIGHEIVSVHLAEAGIEDMSDKIVLTVAEAMSLDPPSPVLVLIGASIQYNLKVIRANVPQVVTLPSPYHQWSALNTSVATVDKLTGVAHALHLGITTVVVEDTRVTGHIQMSSFHVVIPDTLVLYLSPLSDSGDIVEESFSTPSVSRWYVIVNRQYLIRIKAYSQGPGAREILITKKEDIKLHSNQSGSCMTFEVPDDIAAQSGWTNSKILKAVLPGMEKLTASLVYSNGLSQTKEVIKVVQEIIVCDPVKFALDVDNNLDQRILLPWVPSINQEVELKATGGCVKETSDYRWFSSDVSSVSISASGVIEAKKPGKATIKVVSIFDPNNYDEVSVEVSIPSSMAMLPNLPVETVVGSHLQAAVTMTASEGSYFYRCDAFSSAVKWNAGSDTFIVVNGSNDKTSADILYKEMVNSSSYGPPCAWISLYAHDPGHVMLYASISREFDHPLHGSVILKASKRLAAYPPLIVAQASDGNQYGGYWFNVSLRESQKQAYNVENLFLVPDSQLDVLLLGGPRQWDKDISFIEDVEIIGKGHVNYKDGVHVHQIPDIAGLYRIHCRSLGNFQLLFRRANLAGDDHMLPAIEKVTVSVSCSFPSSISILADQHVNDLDAILTTIKAESGPGKVRMPPITVANGRTIRVAAVGITDSGKAFANSSSLSLSWELANCDELAFWDDNHISDMSVSIWERFLVLRNESGMCDVRASAVLPSTMNGYSSLPQFRTSDFALEDAVRLQLVSTLSLNPEFSLVFFHPDVKMCVKIVEVLAKFFEKWSSVSNIVDLSIIGGSCLLDARANDSRVVELIQPPDGLRCTQVILAPRGFGTAAITIKDIGLTPPLAASSLVQVADVDWIRINSPDEISIMEGSSQYFDLIAGVDDGNAFDPSQLAYMNIHLHVESHIINLINDGDSESPGSKIIIKAKHLGLTTFYVSAKQHSGREIFSQGVKVEVYEAPRIHPDDIFLVPGASFVLTLNGGPTMGTFVVYGTSDNGTAVIHQSTGRLSAISPGNTTIVATVFGKRDTVICQTYAKVRVGVPSSARLSVQSEHLSIGREMPIFPSLSEGGLFSFYELCKNYKWVTEDDKVISLYAPTHQRHVSKSMAASWSGEEDLFWELLYARSPGSTKLTVSFSCEFVTARFSQSRTYSAAISLVVVPDLPLALGAPLTWILPPHYTSSSLLPFSSRLFNERDVKSQKGTIIYSVLRICGEKTDDVLNGGISIHGDKIKTGVSNVLACIKAEDRTTRKVEIASCIRVAEVAQVRIQRAEIPLAVIDLAVGAELEFHVKHYDALGNPFHEAYNVVDLTASTNYANVVSINRTDSVEGRILIKGVGRGRALVQLSSNLGLEKTDYVLISVGAHLYPQNPVLQVGRSLVFGIDGLNNESLGRWKSVDENVVHVDPLSGKAQAVAEGTTQVFYTCSEGRLQTTITVPRGNILIVEAENETLTNVPYPSKGHFFSVELRGETGEKLNNDIDDEVLYKCWVDPPFVGYTKPWRDFESGKSFCLFFPYTPEHLVHSMPKSKDLRPDISVTISASLNEASHISGHTSVMFIGGFSVLDTGKLNLGPHQNRSIITVLGNTDVEVQWQYHDAISVSPIVKESFGIVGRTQYEVKMLKAKKLKEKILIRLPANGQLVEVDVEYEPPVEPASKFTFPSVPLTSVLLTLAVLILTVLLLYVMDRPRIRRQSHAPSTPSTAGPVTPQRSSPSAVGNGHSPRTPQPFVEYVRRTIDETPYYRREGRRFNPQNTY